MFKQTIGVKRQLSACFSCLKHTIINDPSFNLRLINELNKTETLK